MARVTHLDESVFKFLNDLEKNNNRDWFAENKPKYLAANEHFKALAEEINEGMQKQDHLEKMKLYRIYRDVRFSKNKAPYKNSFSGGFTRATKALRGGYYLHLQPGGNSMVGGGLILPHAIGILPILTPIAAVGVILTMLGALALHVKRNDGIGAIAPNILIMLIAFAVAYGRFVLVPFS